VKRTFTACHFFCSGWALLAARVGFKFVANPPKQVIHYFSGIRFCLELLSTTVSGSPLGED
jgi:hypothetical protein